MLNLKVKYNWIATLAVIIPALPYISIQLKYIAGENETKNVHMLRHKLF